MVYGFIRVVRVFRSISLFRNSQRHKHFHIINYQKTYIILHRNVKMCYKRLCFHYTILTAFRQGIFTHNFIIYHYFLFVIFFFSYNNKITKTFTKDMAYILVCELIYGDNAWSNGSIVIIRN